MHTDAVLANFEARHAALFGRHTIALQHRLHESPLFSDDALARLIEETPRSRYHVNTMDATAHDPRSWREGEIVDLNGSQVLEAVRRGKIWLLVEKLEEVDSAYSKLLGAMYDEFEAQVPGLKTFRHRMSILISSPGVQVYYHADAPGQMLWQVRGQKRVYIYPPSEPFLPQDRLERIILGDVHEISLDYHPWFDEYAEVLDLVPGRMVYWPLNSPHRIVNQDCLNVSVTTEHFTSSVRSKYLVNYANGLCRRVLRSRRFSQSVDGPAAWTKFGLAGIVKATGLKKPAKRHFTVDFHVDPTAQLGVRDVPPRRILK
jgi:hypothetical protein